ncbi:S8 family serine peptidase [Geminicoccus roseus]|uniref:S8 family serine peptidase n=1 Tax=Geminicoccus roseus TaxID=404900 RepID=UPI00041E2A47|nr:S8 family serine peptidase [Geminicoccus roseus]
MTTLPRDPLFDQQWHLLNTGQSGGTSGIDVRVTEVWEDYTGRGVRVAVFDEGVEGDHPDLAANFDRTDGYDTSSGKAGPGLPVLPDDNHGTMVAGFIGEVAGNGIGGVGVAHEATLVAYRMPLGDDDEDDPDPEATQNRFERIGFEQQLLQGVDVSSNSWGGVLMEAPDPDSLEAIIRLATEGRDGLGTAIVFAGGNERDETTLTSGDEHQSQPYVISVAAVDHDGRATWFSNPGSSLLVTAPGENVLSTDRVPPNGYDPTSDYSADNGTSFSAPMVSGVVALMLEANPLLGARDVQNILAASAWKPDGADSWMKSADQVMEVMGPHIEGFSEALAQLYVKPWDWQVNGAADWNGGGRQVSHDYGMGLVDARAAVRMAESWGKDAQTFGNDREIAVTDTESTTLEAGSSVDYAISFADADGVAVEHLTLRLELALATDATLADVLDIYDALDITLTSEDGTVSYLLTGFDANIWSAFEADADLTERTDEDTLELQLGTTQHWGEAADQVWTVEIANNSGKNETVTVESLTLTVQGGAASTDDLYLFTDEYAGLAADDPSRQLLADRNGGQDTVNFAALTSDLEIFLDGSQGSVGDAAWGPAPNIRIEHAIGGDGADRIGGSNENNWLRGMRGDDVLSGEAGNDRLEGGAGNDRLDGGDGIDRLFGHDGDDILLDGAGGSLLSGGRGNDTVGGGAGDDTLYGFAGNDVLQGGEGDDILAGGKGDDLLEGGLGSDTIVVDGLLAHFRLEGDDEAGSLTDLGIALPDQGSDRFTSIEIIQFTDQTLGWNGQAWTGIA